jgi:hypothetical protein
MVLQGGLETFDKTLPVDGLSQIANRAGFQRMDTNSLVGKGREENEWHAVPMGQQVRSQLDATHAGHLDI